MPSVHPAVLRSFRRGIVLASAVAVIVLGASSCGTADSSSADPVSLTCEDDLTAIVALLRSGLPTYDYDPAADLPSLVERVEVVATGTISSVARVAEVDISGPDTPGDDSWTAVASAGSEFLHPTNPTIDPSGFQFSIDSKWAARDADPLADPILVDGLGYVAFLHPSPQAPGGYTIDVQGLSVGCVGSSLAAQPIIEPLPADARGLSVDELAAAIDGQRTSTATSSSTTIAEQTAAVGTELGRGSVGPPLIAPVEHHLNTIYRDPDEPNRLTVEFMPPDPTCIAAVATATVGRGGAVLVTLFVEGGPSEPCEDGGHTNRVVIDLHEPLGDRFIYTSRLHEADGAAQAAEELADAIIGLHIDDAIELVEVSGLVLRDLTDVTSVDDDLRFDRINVRRDHDGIVVFAAVY